MEIPCKYKFTGEEDIIEKLKKLLPPDIKSEHEPKEVSYENNIKRRKVMDVEVTFSDDEEVCNLEVQLSVTYGSYSLFFRDKNILRNGKDLNDMHVNFGQTLIKEQYPDIGGLKCTLTITKRGYHYPDSEVLFFKLFIL